MCYYTKEDLCKITIEQFVPQLKEDKTICFTEEMLIDDNYGFPDVNADYFRQGACDLFANALHTKFDYPAYIIRSNGAFHIFCKSFDETQYIDVRGKTESKEQFIEGTAFIKLDANSTDTYVFDKEDFCIPHSDVILAFARLIIESDIERYMC